MLAIKHPARLQPGASIGIAAPSGPFARERFRRGLDRLRAFGFEVVLPAGLVDRGEKDRDDDDDGEYERAGDTLPYLAADDAFRAQTLEAIFLDDDIDAVWCARGGYGAMRILRRLDPTVFRAHPKLLVGFSDITALHGLLGAASGVASLHGPNVTTLGSLRDDDAAVLCRLLAGGAAGPVVGAPLRVLRGGRASGPIVGGNLSLLSSLVGTACFPPVDGAILFIEDVNEEPYRVDRMLAHLDLAGVFRRIAGLLAGTFVDCRKDGVEAIDVIADCASTLAVPVVAGFPAGHGEEQRPIPLGCRCDLDADRASVDFPEPLCG